MMAKKIFNRRVTALLLVLVMCFSMFKVAAQAAPWRPNRPGGSDDGAVTLYWCYAADSTGGDYSSDLGQATATYNGSTWAFGTSQTLEASASASIVITPAAGYRIAQIDMLCTGGRDTDNPYSCNTYNEGASYSVSPEAGGTSITISNFTKDTACDHASNSHKYYIMITTEPVDTTVTYTVTYKPGTGNGTDYTDNNGGSGYTCAVNYTVLGVDAENIGFTKSGYTFAGWQVTACEDSNELYNILGNVYSAADEFLMPASNVELTALWVENEVHDYSVIYNGNGGTLAGGEAVYNDSENISGTEATAHNIGVDSNEFARENYTFAGWNTAADGSGTAYAEGTVIALTSADNTRTLYAQWQENPKYDYTVIYNANFGDSPATMADEQNAVQIYEDSYTILVNDCEFVRENYTFVGWATSPDGNVAYGKDDPISFTGGGSQILYAKWIENDKYAYSVIYNGNGGALSGGELAYGDSENIEETYAKEAKIKVDENTFARENHTFVGWNTAADGSGTEYTAEDVINLTFTDNTLTLFAQWEEHPKYDYTVIYNGNGGALENEAVSYGDSENIQQTYAKEAEIKVDENSFVRENYTFTGWNTAADGSGKAYSAEDVLKLTAEENTATLYAQWQENPKYDYTVIYEGNFEGAPEAMADEQNAVQIYKDSYTIDVNRNEFVRENYTFVGWNTAADGSGVAYSVGQAIALTAENNTVTLYAQWVEYPKYDYTVIYEANYEGAPEAKKDPESISGIYATSHNVEVDANSFFLRENYTFTGWNTKADGSGTAYAPGDKVQLTTDNNTLTLYAQWVENDKFDYTLIYNANFGESPATKTDTESVTQTYALSHSIGVDDNEFVRENYTFVGWNTAADGSGAAYSFAQTVALTAENNTVTLYAQWEENPKYDYTVIYNANFGESPATMADEQNAVQIYDTTYTIGVNANEFVRENYTFAGWAYTPDGEVDVQAGDSISFAEGGSQTLYAKWIEHDKYNYTVIYNGNGGALENEAVSYGDSENIQQTYAKEAEIKVDENSFVRENYTFTGWNTAADGSGKAYSAEDALKLTAKENTATLYAQWEENAKYDYTVTYEGNFEGAPEAREDAENVKQTYAATYTIGVDANSFEREGYTFGGWATTPEGEAIYEEGDEISFTEGGSYTLYAVWTINEYEYTVEYMVRVDGGEYQKFTGELPEGAPQAGKAPYDTLIDEEYLENLPANINDGTHTYDFTAIDEITVPYGTNTVIVYYTYISPAPPAEDPAPPAPPAQQNGDGLVDIPDEDVPLADVPKTGDPMYLYVGMTALSGLGLLGLTRKKDEEDEEE